MVVVPVYLPLLWCNGLRDMIYEQLSYSAALLQLHASKFSLVFFSEYKVFSLLIYQQPPHKFDGT